MVWVVAGLVLAVVYWRVVAGGGPKGLRDALVKAGSVAVLGLGAVAGGAPVAVAAGLLLGAAGDFALARPGERWFLAGMAAFAAGHLAYVVAFLLMGAGWPPVWLVLALAVLAGSTEWWLAPRTGALQGPVRGYVGVIVLMALVAGGLPAGFGVVQAGVALFVASDLILALERFVLRDGVWRRRCAVLLWPLYWGGQALILWGALPPGAPSA